MRTGPLAAVGRLILSAIAYLAAAYITISLAEAIWSYPDSPDRHIRLHYQILLSILAWGTGGGIAAAGMPLRNTGKVRFLWIALAAVQADLVIAAIMFTFFGPVYFSGELPVVFLVEAFGAMLATVFYFIFVQLCLLAIAV